MTRQILVTSALPYANGPIHIGHLVEYIQTDIWVRFQKLRGNHCVYICADDTHGTAIMIRAKKEGRSEKELIAAMSEEHQRDFAGFGIRFDHYGSTDSEENRQVCASFWQSLRDAGLIVERSIEQLFDPEAETFLGRSIRARHLSILQAGKPSRRQLRQRPHLQPDGVDRSEKYAKWCDAGFEGFATSVRQARTAA